MGETKIEWVIGPDGSRGHTINPIRFRNLETGQVGHHCQKISPGCANCYASTMQSPYLSGLEFIAENRAKGKFFLEQKALDQVLRRRKPMGYFWCDMTDMFGEWVPDEWIDQCFGVMAATPQHRHFVLTKRPNRAAKYYNQFALDGQGFVTRGGVDYSAATAITDPARWPLPNVWLGVSVEDQQRADERIPHLLTTPAAVRFLSVEPLLGPVDLSHYLGAPFPPNGVIVGGESGPGARPCAVEWVRSIQQQCQQAGVRFFFKQWGAYPTMGGKRIELRDPKGGDPSEWPEDLRVREMPGGRP